VRFSDEASVRQLVMLLDSVMSAEITRPNIWQIVQI